LQHPLCRRRDYLYLYERNRPATRLPDLAMLGAQQCLSSVPAQAARRKPWDRIWNDQSGSIAVLTALGSTVLLGMAGLGTEVGVWYYTHQNMQGAADMAALSAANAYATQSSSSGLLTQAQAATAAYGFVSGVKNVTVALNQPPTSGSHTDIANAVEVIVSQPQTRLFSKMFSSSQVTISARAVAVPRSGLGCVLNLDPTASGATALKGSTTVALNGCSLMDNSNSPSALNMNGGAILSALSVNVVGGSPELRRYLPPTGPIRV
jgi:Flp pilus assembly protein TadG